MPTSGRGSDPGRPRWPGRARRAAAYAWASPTTLVGLSVGALTLATGGRVRRRRGALEFHGGFARRFLERAAGASAMALGHVILGCDEDCLDRCRDHEQVHVRQAEVWGPAFVPAYLLASARAWARGGHYYFDNEFEVDARRQSHETALRPDGEIPGPFGPPTHPGKHP